MRYDPNNAPDPEQWLRLEEQLRMERVRKSHEESGEASEDERRSLLHAVAHTVVENQIALEDPPSTAACVKRLMAEGLSRHDAIHAAASVVINHLSKIAEIGGHSETPDVRAFSAELDRMSRKVWESLGDPDPAEAMAGARTALNPDDYDPMPSNAEYVFCLGPIDHGDGESFVAAMVDKSGDLQRPVFEKSARRAIKKTLGNKKGRAVWCPPDLEEFAPEFKLSVGLPNDEAVAAQAVLSTVMHNATLKPELSEQLHDTLEAVGQFAEAAPWQWWEGEDRIVATVRIGERVETWDLALMGRAGMEEGVALYPEGMLRRIEEFEGRSVPDRVRAFSFDDVNFGRVFELLWGRPSVPRFMRLDRGEVTGWDRASLSMLCAAIRASCLLSPTRATATATYSNVTIELQAPPPRAEEE